MGSYSCEYGGFNNIGVHLLVFIITFPILVLKWKMEDPKRTFNVWLMDISKQIVCLMVSLYTLVNSRDMKDYCIKYFVVILTDGIIANFFSLTLQAVVQNIFMNWRSMKFVSGNYTSEHLLLSWIYQITIWTTVCLISKFIVSLFVSQWEIPLYFAGSMVLLPFKRSPKIEAFIILVLFPIITNLIVLWVIDEFLMDPTHNFIHHWDHKKNSKMSDI